MFVATLVCLVQDSRYRKFCEKETFASHQLQVCGFSVSVGPTVPVLESKLSLIGYSYPLDELVNLPSRVRCARLARPVMAAISGGG